MRHWAVGFWNKRACPPSVRWACRRRSGRPTIPTARSTSCRSHWTAAPRFGALALTGVTYGGIGERSGLPPTAKELDNVARVIEAAARIAKGHGLLFGIEPVNRYETHLINTATQGVAMIERVGVDNLFLHLDTYHMNIEEKGQANGILAAREHPALHPPVGIRPRHAGRGDLRLGRDFCRLGRHRVRGRAGNGKLRQHASGNRPWPVGLAARGG